MSDFRDALPLSMAQRRELLDRLDAVARRFDEAEAEGRNDRRTHERHPYRIAGLELIIEHLSGGSSNVLITTRDISAGGLGFLHGGFIHPGSKCWITLRRSNGMPMTVAGRITSCRHVEGIVHAAGVMFESAIDIDQLVGVRKHDEPPMSQAASPAEDSVDAIDEADEAMGEAQAA